MKRKMLFAIRRLWYGPPDVRSYCSHVCVLCGQSISHYLLDCKEKRTEIYAPHVDCPPARLSVEFAMLRRQRREESLGLRDDAHLGAEER